MSVLLDLPRVLKLPLLNNWLAIENVALVDSSLCNYGLRKLFLELISEPYFKSSGSTNFQNNIYFKWLLKRSIKVESVKCFTNTSEILSLYCSNLTFCPQNVSLCFDSGFPKHIETIKLTVKSLNIMCNSPTIDELTKILLNHLFNCGVLEHCHLGLYHQHIADDDEEEEDEDEDEEVEHMNESELTEDDKMNSNANTTKESVEEDEDIDNDPTENYIHNPDRSECSEEFDTEHEEMMALMGLEYEDQSDSESDGEIHRSYTDLKIVHASVSHFDLYKEYSCLARPLSSLLSFACTFPDLCDTFLLILTSVAPNLVAVNISNCQLLTDKSVAKLGTNCKRLKHVDISLNLFLTDTALFGLAQCLELESLDITLCSAFTEYALITLITKCTRLKHIFNTQGYKPSPTFTHQILVSLSEQHPLSLESLDIVRGNKLLFFNTLDRLVKSCGNLMYLNLRNCGLQDATVRDAFKYCVNLTKLDVSCNSTLTSASLENLHYATMLSDLNIAQCGIVGINCGGILACKNLTSLNGCDCFVEHEFYSSTPPHSRSLWHRNLLENCVHLTWLDVSCCQFIVYEDLVMFLTGASKLKFINISCTGLDLPEILALFEMFPRVEFNHYDSDLIDYDADGVKCDDEEVKEGEEEV